MPRTTSMPDCCGVNDPCLTRGGVKVCPVCEKGPDRTVEKAWDDFVKALNDSRWSMNNVDLPAARAALEAAIARQARQPLLDLLRELEWMTFYNDDEGGVVERCVSCMTLKATGHTPDCRLGAILKECP